VVRVLATSADRYFGDRCPLHAAGIAYRVLFSSVPLAIVLVSLFDLILGNQGVHDAVVDTIVSALPTTAAHKTDVANEITGIATPPGLVGLLTLGVFVWSATGMMAAIRAGLEVATHAQHSRPLVRGKLVDLVLLVGAALLVLATVAATALDKLIQHALRRVESATGIESPLLGAVLPRMIALAVSIVVVMLLYRLVPSRRMHRGDALAGAVTTSILLLGISLASSLVYSSATHLSVVYGSLTAAFVFLYSVYLYACALLFGAQVAAAWSLPVMPGGPPLRTQVRRALRGLVTTSEGPTDRP
jgi:membrane protein